MAANRGKSSKAHGGNTRRGKMTRGTKIRKRVFGVTSLILAVVLANIPLGAGAFAPVANDAPLSVLNAVDTGVMLYGDNTSKIDNASGVDDGGGTIYYGVRINATADHSATGFTDPTHPAGFDFTNTYYPYLPLTTPLTNTYKEKTEWGDTQKVYVGIREMQRVLTSPDNWVDQFSQKYGQQLRLYREFTTDDPITGSSTYKWEMDSNYSNYYGGNLSKPNELYSEWGGIETDYSVRRIGVAYRPMVNILKTGTLEATKFDYNKAMASVYPGSETAAWVNQTHSMQFDKIDSGTISKIKSEIPNYSQIKDEDYFEFNVKLMDNANHVVGVDDLTALSIPLPDSMRAKGSETQGTYEVYWLKDGTDAVKIDKVYPIALSDGKYAVQFEMAFENTGTTTAPLVSPYKDPKNALGYDIAVVYKRGTGGGGSTTYNVTATSADPSKGTVNVSPAAPQAAGSTVTVTATPVSGYYFEKWTESGEYNNNSNGTLTITGLSRDITLTAHFSDTKPSTGTLNVKLTGTGKGTVNGNTSDFMLTPVIGSTVTLHAMPDASSDFVEWQYGSTVQTGDTFTIPINNAIPVTVTAKFEAKQFTISIVDNRLQPNKANDTAPTIAITPDPGALTGHTQVTVTEMANPSHLTAALTEHQRSSTYPEGFDFFEFIDITKGAIALNDPNTISIANLPVPRSMKLSEGDVTLLYYDTGSGKVRKVPIQQTDDAADLISFTLPVTSGSTVLDGEYIFGYRYNPDKAILTVKDNRAGRPADSTKESNSELPGNRVLTVSDAPAIEAAAADPGSDFIFGDDGSGNTITKLPHDGYTAFELKLTGTKIVRDGSGNQTTQVLDPATDVDVITANIPLSTVVHSEDMTVYKVEENLGVITSFKALAKKDVKTKTLNTNETQLTLTLKKNSDTDQDYNAYYVVVYSKTPEKAVRDQRLDAHSPDAYVVNDQWPDNTIDRYLIIETIRSGDHLTPLVKQDPELKDYDVRAYDIRYVDEHGNKIPLAANEYIPIGLTIPDDIKGSYDIQLVSIDPVTGKLQKENNPIWINSKTDNVIEFIADHFSEYGIASLRSAPPATDFAIAASADPVYGGSISGAGVLPAGSTATLVATPSPNYEFVRWEVTSGTGPSDPTNPTWTFTVTEPKTVVAKFAPVGSSGGSTSGGGATSGDTSGGGATSGDTSGGGATSGGTGQQGPAGPQGPQGPAGPQGPQGPAGTVTVIDGAGQTVYSGTGSTGGTVIYTGKGSNSIDMPRTGLMDHYNVYKMLGVVILTMFGVLELVSSLNTKRRRVTV